MKRFIPVLTLLLPFITVACSDGLTDSHSTQPEFRSATTQIVLRDLVPAAAIETPAEEGFVPAPPGTIMYTYDATARRLTFRHLDAVFRDGDAPVVLRLDREENILTIIEEQNGGGDMLRRYDVTAEIRGLPAGVYRVLVVEPFPEEEQLPLTFRLDLYADAEGRFDRPQTADIASLSR